MLHPVQQFRNLTKAYQQADALEHSNAMQAEDLFGALMVKLAPTARLGAELRRRVSEIGAAEPTYVTEALRAHAYTFEFNMLEAGQRMFDKAISLTDNPTIKLGILQCQNYATLCTGVGDVRANINEGMSYALAARLRTVPVRIAIAQALIEPEPSDTFEALAAQANRSVFDPMAESNCMKAMGDLVVKHSGGAAAHLRKALEFYRRAKTLREDVAGLKVETEATAWADAMKLEWLEWTLGKKLSSKDRYAFREYLNELLPCGSFSDARPNLVVNQPLLLAFQLVAAGRTKKDKVMMLRVFEQIAPTLDRETSQKLKLFLAAKSGRFKSLGFPKRIQSEAGVHSPNLRRRSLLVLARKASRNPNLSSAVPGLVALAEEVGRERKIFIPELDDDHLWPAPRLLTAGAVTQPDGVSVTHTLLHTLPEILDSVRGTHARQVFDACGPRNQKRAAGLLGRNYYLALEDLKLPELPEIDGAPVWMANCMDKTHHETAQEVEEAVVLHFVGKPYRQIAWILGIATGKLRATMKRIFGKADEDLKARVVRSYLSNGRKQRVKNQAELVGSHHEEEGKRKLERVARQLGISLDEILSLKGLSKKAPRSKVRRKKPL